MAHLNKSSIVLLPVAPLNRQKRQNSYQTKQWRDLRNLYLIQHPLCEKCLEEGKVTETQDIHHKLSPFESGISEAEKQRRLLDWNNLQALCKECHSLTHIELEKSKKSSTIKKITKRK